ncbi:hypothetical protein CN878_20550 [Ochrobactrum sp. 695/2009]|nr:hypothetical protein CN881_12810 [Ochrobactrum sp. 721/2009]PJT16645.1 hypothetical protein CN880_09925 [Ochrobactrum sp. 720/2009]PJT26467.1 hypothetical protein CN879_05890 [Ochrobactrum sp. 715/2009]PJT26843.1 hypothetical protein CN878_20550 [Ochrobactrum sp. 695/2009]PJT35987.1 hypothetical protein CN877_08335 [Ochrobactrum sp. 689/2009]
MRNSIAFFQDVEAIRLTRLDVLEGFCKSLLQMLRWNTKKSHATGVKASVASIRSANKMLGFQYPQNNFFYGCLIKGYDVAEAPGTGKLIGPNMFIHMTTMDGETLPAHPKLPGFTDTGKFFNAIVIDKNVLAYELRSYEG